MELIYIIIAALVLFGVFAVPKIREAARLSKQERENSAKALAISKGVSYTRPS